MSEQRFGRKVFTPSDFNSMLRDIEKNTHEKISLSTLKRIWGYVKSDHEPSFTILSILARYNGYSDFSDFEHSLDSRDGSDSEFFMGKTVLSTNLTAGNRVKLGWDNNKHCTLQLIQGDLYRVVESVNIKLSVDDVLQCPLFCLGRPFIAFNIRRAEGIMPVYTAALNNGLKTIIVDNN